MSEIPLPPPPIEPEPIKPAPLIPGPGPIPAPPIPAPPPEPEPAPPPEPAPVPLPVPAPGPSLPGALPDIGILAALLVILGLIALAAALVEFLNWLFAKMLGPVGRRGGSPKLNTQQLLQPLSNTLGKWEQGVDNQIALSFYKLGQLTGRVGGALVRGAQVSYQLGAQLARVKQHQLSQDQQAGKTAHTATNAETAAQHAAAAAVAGAAAATAGEHALNQRLDGLTHHITHLIEPELDALREKIPKLEQGASTAWDLLRQHEEALGLGALTAGVATGLGRLGADWIQCEANQLLGRANCGRNSDIIRKLLAGALDVLIVTDICDFAAGVTVLAESLQPAMIAFVDTEFALVGCHGASKPNRILLPPLSLAPVFDPVTI